MCAGRRVKGAQGGRPCGVRGTLELLRRRLSASRWSRWTWDARSLLPAVLASVRAGLTTAVATPCACLCVWWCMAGGFPDAPAHRSVRGIVEFCVGLLFVGCCAVVCGGWVGVWLWCARVHVGVACRWGHWHAWSVACALLQLPVRFCPCAKRAPSCQATHGDITICMAPVHTPASARFVDDRARTSANSRQ